MKKIDFTVSSDDKTTVLILLLLNTAFMKLAYSVYQLLPVLSGTRQPVGIHKPVALISFPLDTGICLQARAAHGQPLSVTELNLNCISNNITKNVCLYENKTYPAGLRAR